jgi:phosphoribosylformylglycinamidine cyclo-ligase
LFILDYVAMSRDDPETLEQIVSGISAGCLQAGCALLGGETAIMPDMYQQGHYDLAGFAVGVVERRRLIDGSDVKAGDLVIGLASTGIHSNGFSLVRKIVFETAGLNIDSPVSGLGGTVGEILLTPTQIYAALIADLLQQPSRALTVHGLAHITGGGLAENIERILPDGVDVRIDGRAWQIPGVFSWIRQLGNVTTREMYRVFNMGIGMVVIVPSRSASKVHEIARDHDVAGWVIGEVVEGQGKVRVTGRRTRS